MSSTRAATFAFAFALALAAAAGAREPRATGYVKYAMPAYTLVAGDERVARDVVSEIEKIDQLLGTILQRPSSVPDTPVSIFVVPDRLWHGYLAPGPGISAEFVPARFGNYLLLRTGGDISLLREGLYHEYAHLFLRTQFRGAYPLWFDEGMAELVQRTRFRGKGAEIGLPAWSPGLWLPIERVLDLQESSLENHGGRYTNSVHAQAWSLVHRGLITDEEFGRQLFAYLDAVNRLEPIDAAVRSSFGMSIDELDASMRDYFWRPTFSGARLAFEPPVPAAPSPGVPMSETEMLELLAEVMLVSGFKPERLGEVIDAAFRRDPQSASGHVLRMRLAIRDGDDAAFLRLLKEIEPRTTDPRVARRVGLALVERLRKGQSGDQFDPGAPAALTTPAQDMLDRALRAQPADPEAAWAYGLLAALTKTYLNTALVRVRQAEAQMPYNADLSLVAALLHEALGETEQSVRLLQDTVRYSVSADQRKWARMRVGQLQSVDRR